MSTCTAAQIESMINGHNQKCKVHATCGVGKELVAKIRTAINKFSQINDQEVINKVASDIKNMSSIKHLAQYIDKQRHVIDMMARKMIEVKYPVRVNSIDGLIRLVSFEHCVCYIEIIVDGKKNIIECLLSEICFAECQTGGDINDIMRETKIVNEKVEIIKPEEFRCD